MHPDMISALAAQHRADLLRTAARQRARQPGARRPRPLTAAFRWLRHMGRPRLSGGAAARGLLPAPLPEALADGPEAYGFRVYLTPAESRRLALHCLALLDRYADRLADPAARPPGAEPLELVLLSRRLTAAR